MHLRVRELNVTLTSRLTSWQLPAVDLTFLHINFSTWEKGTNVVCLLGLAEMEPISTIWQILFTCPDLDKT